MTYARRYNIVNLLNLVADEDDDGNRASQSKEQPKAITTQSFGQEVQNALLMPGEIVPKWWWDLKKTDWKEAGKYMPKGYGPKKIDGKYIVAERDQTPIKYEEDVF